MGAVGAAIGRGERRGTSVEEMRDLIGKRGHWVIQPTWRRPGRDHRPDESSHSPQRADLGTQPSGSLPTRDDVCITQEEKLP